MTATSSRTETARTRSGCTYVIRRPARGRAGAPPLVAVHGISRNADEHLDAFAGAAERAGATLVVPHFDADRRGYQVLRSRDGATCADRDLVEMLDTLGAPRADLIGFSGGAQFAHRFALVRPERVARVVAVSAGWYTFPDPRRRFPHGLRASRRHAELVPDLAAFLALPLLLVVGALDTGRDAALRTDAHTEAVQGANRVVRAERFRAALLRAAAAAEVRADVRRVILPGVGHSFADAVARGGLVARCEEFLYGRSAECALSAAPRPDARDLLRTDRGAAGR